MGSDYTLSSGGRFSCSLSIGATRGNVVNNIAITDDAGALLSLSAMRSSCVSPERPQFGDADQQSPVAGHRVNPATLRRHFKR
jgi:hypothetical protein